MTAKRRLRRRLRQVGFVSSAVIVGILVVGIALALVLVQITGTVSSNEFVPTTTTSTTTTTTIPAGDGLQAAVSATGGAGGDCSNAFTAGTVALGAITFDLNNTSMQPYNPPNFLCVANVGPGQIGNLAVAVTSTSSTEAGCSASEETVDPEGAGCGSDGELVDVIEVILQPAILQDAGCRPDAFLLIPGTPPVTLLTGVGQLSPGFSCSYQVLLRIAGVATHDQKLAASTDDVTFTIEVSGSA